MSKKSPLQHQIVILPAFLVFLFFSGVLHSYEPVSATELALGTYVKITLERTDRADKILREAFQKIKSLESKFSVFRPESELSLLNKQGRMEVSEEMLKVLRQAVQISEITGGAFDITCRPLVELYEDAGKKGVPPSPAEIASVRKLVGWRRIRFQRNLVELEPAMKLDLGGVAPGFIVDETAALLKARGIKNALIDAGGDIFCFGTNPEGKKWRIGIKHPRKKGEVISILEITGQAVATSGDYEKFVQIKGRKYGHIVNSKTGETVQDFPVSVTIVAPDCTVADGLATGCFVLGREKGMELLKKLPGIEGLIIDADMHTSQTKGFKLLQGLPVQVP